MKETKNLDLKKMEKVNGGINLIDVLTHSSIELQKADMGSPSEPQQKHTIGLPI